MATRPLYALFLLTWLVIFHAGQSCEPSGHLPGTTSPNCNTGNGAECCKAGESYLQFKCSPDITGNAPAKMTLNGFGEGEEGGGASECDGQFHSNKELIVALSTGWYANGSRCQKTIKINANNGKSVLAKVVDECDSVNGCDAEHAYQPPCANNIVDASRAVWEALEIPESQIGEYDIIWSDA